MRTMNRIWSLLIILAILLAGVVMMIIVPGLGLIAFIAALVIAGIMLYTIFAGASEAIDQAGEEDVPNRRSLR